MGKLILLVADSAESLGELKRALSNFSSDCQIHSAETCDEIAALPLPSLILLDLLLASEPASKVLVWLRAQPTYRDIPVFVLGSESVERDITEAFRRGAGSCFVLTGARDQFEPLAEGLAIYASLLPISTEEPHHSRETGA